MARLIFYRMSKDAEQPEELTPYPDQSLQLSKYFADWPSKLVKIDETGRVAKAERS